jgi:ribosomal protein S18 acetylase RimI-like enzyme
MIRKAMAQDVNHCVNLIYMAAEKELKFIFGDEAVIKKFLAHLVGLPDNIFSRDFIWVDENEKTGDLRGMVSLVKGKSVSGLKFSIANQFTVLAKLIGMTGMLHVIGESLKLSAVQPKIRKDEFYISSLAVYPEFRGKKVASGLLKFAIEYAKVAHYKKLSLGVEMGNEKAFEIYKKYGFIVTATRSLKKSVRKYGLSGHFKMVKELS